MLWIALVSSLVLAVVCWLVFVRKNLIYTPEGDALNPKGSDALAWVGLFFALLVPCLFGAIVAN